MTDIRTATHPASSNGVVATPPAAEASPKTPAEGSEASKRVVPAAPRGPPLWKIHELPVPVRTFPLPSFYPNNPLSLFHVAYAWATQVLSPPREPSAVHLGIWSPKTRSVHITDPKSIRALWEQGFYGKGHLSRSEPNWLKREQARTGAHKDHVAEVFTMKRREERMQMKWERAKKEQEAIQRTRYEEARIAPVGPKELLALPNSSQELDSVIYGLLPNGLIGEAMSNDTFYQEPSPIVESNVVSLENGNATFPLLNGGHKRPQTPTSKPATSPNESPENGQPPMRRRKSVRFSPKVESTTFQYSDPPSPKQTMMAVGNGNGKAPDGILTNGASPLSRESSLLLGEVPTMSPIPEADMPALPAESAPILDKEHLQLTLEETFWLSFGLGVLEVKDEKTNASLPTEALFRLCREHSYFPHRTTGLQPDDPFLIHYAVYHHFRSLGWVTRPGIKFGCDWLLYHRGPAFSHAEFAIVVLPSYSDPYWKKQGRDKSDKSWHWLHLVNRVQSTALKTLILVYVDVPAPAEVDLDIPSTLKRYKIREVMVKRWLINRNRD
ncbi:hypothetical protein JX265_005612 [Neoarthrinium moseri]|uniref:tRNA-intron lyase n=1 Tax=Neoarthrinium moseri TaxID=1658444 RepID=A0A9P9WMV4_9PEZI|nr:hypothetical protein JX265_005612 [Neoarthrinium moseri]